MTVSTRTCPTCETPLPRDAAYCALCGSPTATEVIGETQAFRTGPGSASYEHAPDRLRRALGPNFELGRLIGRGGYAEVFAIRDLKLKRDLAVKVLRPDLIVTAALLERFRREALAVAALQHPAIVPVYDVGEADGICYIVMPLIRGESLKAVLQRQRRLPIEDVQRIVLEAANALAVAHQAIVVHRDIKPENIMLEGAERNVRLMDFGIAKAVDSSEKELTGTGVVVGTPQYMSPEQASGEPNIDHRSDQYSLAVVAYQMLAGRAPFDGETARAIIAKQLLDPPPPLASLVEDLPLHIAAALHRAMQKNAKNRFDSIKDFAAALKNPAYVGPTSEEEPGRHVPKRPPTWAPWLAAAVATVVLVAVAATQWRTKAPSPSSPTAVRDSTPIIGPPSTPQAVTPKNAPIPPRTNPVQRDTSVKVAVDPATVVGSKPDSTAAPTTPPPSCQTLFGTGDLDRALAVCEARANEGDVGSSRTVGLILLRRADTDRAALFFKKAAEGGDPESQMWMAERLESSEPSEATKLYLAAANNNWKPAYQIVARRLLSGIGTAVNEPLALRWYVLAANGGDSRSQLELAQLYATSRTRAIRNDSESRFWLFKAASGGSPNHEAQYQLAMIYLEGRGVKKSEETGMEYLKLAADGGHPDAKKELKKRTD